MLELEFLPEDYPRQRRRNRRLARSGMAALVVALFVVAGFLARSPARLRKAPSALGPFDGFGKLTAGKLTADSLRTGPITTHNARTPTARRGDDRPTSNDGIAEAK